MKFPLDKGAWHNERDDRTNHSESIKELDNYHLGIIVDPRIVESFEIQCMTLLACNILARWCRKITIDMQNCQNIIHHTQSDLKMEIKQLMSEIDPYGEFSFEHIPQDVDDILAIGNGVKSDKPFTWINSDGWISGCGFGNRAGEIHYSGSNNPIGPSFAACFGVAQVFKKAIKKESDSFEKWYSLYDYSNGASSVGLQNPDFCNDFDFGTIYQIGCGAVGSSLDYLISLTNWKGRFFLIDPDIITYSNCNRSLPFSAHDATHSKDKVVVCNNVIASNGREAFPIKKSYSQFSGTREFSKYPPDLILCLANAENVWSTIQNNFPPLVLHATTTKNWGTNFGRHIPKKEWCIMCRFGEHIKDNFIPRCEEGVIRTKNQEEVLGVLPFLSPASAVIMFAEMAKLASNIKSKGNFINMSIEPPFGHLELTYSAKNDCICNTQPLEIFSKFRENTKFWKLANNDHIGIQ